MYAETEIMPSLPTNCVLILSLYRLVHDLVEIANGSGTGGTYRACLVLVSFYS